MCKLKYKNLIIAALTLLWPSLSIAQSAMVTTQNLSAQDCYQTATSIATNESFELSDYMLEPCNAALIELGLSDEDRAATFVNRGILYAASGSLAEALSDYEEALNLFPTLGEIYINRGFLYHFENQLDLALNDYNLALELNVQSKHLAYFARGIVYEDKNLWDEAVKDYEQSLKYSPDWMPAKTRLERVLERNTSSSYELVYND
ncbi:MAG: tetratricopeptide repeat protein [Gammaproteobacteria bacterium]|jgi:tetratricopeptide (TPR) repeat protein|nr:tetratricopeptide repeat protein [Gammaproteobacteria bacterium]